MWKIPGSNPVQYPHPNPRIPPWADSRAPAAAAGNLPRQGFAPWPSGAMIDTNGYLAGPQQDLFRIPQRPGGRVRLEHGPTEP